MSHDDSIHGGHTQDGDIHDLVGAYALGAVEAEERLLFEAHLVDCPDCRRELAELSEVVVALSAGLEVEPPARVRDAVLAQVAAEASPTAEAGATAEAGPTAEVRELHQVDTAASRPSWSTRRWLAGLAAAAAIALGAVAVSVWWPDSETPQLAAEQVLEAADAEHFDEEVGQARVTVVHSAQLQRSVLVTHDMPPAPEGHDYQIWYVHADGTAVSAGLMPREDSDQVTLLLEGEPSGAVAVGVSIEPLGGSEEPTTEPIVAVPLG